MSKNLIENSNQLRRLAYYNINGESLKTGQNGLTLASLQGNRKFNSIGLFPRLLSLSGDLLRKLEVRYISNP